MLSHVKRRPILVLMLFLLVLLVTAGVVNQWIYLTKRDQCMEAFYKRNNTHPEDGYGAMKLWASVYCKVGS